MFKTLFSKEPIEFSDLCETFSVKSALYLDMNESLPDVSEYEKEVEKLEDKYKKGKLSDITFETECAKYVDLIAEGHDYHFIGKVGQFTPIKPGKGGGLLLRQQGEKYYAAANSTGYRWVESEVANAPGNEDNIDMSFYKNMADKMIDEIDKYGDFEWFVSDDPYTPDLVNTWHVPVDADDEVPFV